MDIQEDSVLVTPKPPALCEVCGTDTALHSDAVRVIRHVKDEPEEFITLLCIHCFGKGIKWAATQAFFGGGCIRNFDNT